MRVTLPCLSHKQQIFTANDVWLWRPHFSGKVLTTVWLLSPTNPKKPFCPVFSRLFRKFGNLLQIRWKPAKPWNYSMLSGCAWKLRQLAELLLTSIKIAKAGRKHMNLCLRPASCPYRLYPYDTLCTYGVKQLKLLGFSQRHLFWCSLMVDLKRLELSTSRMRTERSPEWFRYMHPKFLKKCRENKNIEKT